jgi:hypothetical protein
MPSFSMTSSATQTESDRDGEGRQASQARGDDRGGLRWRFELAAGAALAAVGWLVVLFVNRWHLTAPVVFLCLGWVAVILCGRFFWRAAVVAANEGVGPESEGFELSAGRVAELEREKRALLKAIKEVEFDRAMGKMSETDAAEITRVYRARAIDILKELEGQSETGEDEDVPLDRLIDREVRARLALAGVSTKRKPAPRSDAATAAQAPTSEKTPESPADSDKAADPGAQSATSGASEVERREDA